MCQFKRNKKTDDKVIDIYKFGKGLQNHYISGIAEV